MAYFVSDNKSDFCNKNDTRCFHEDILPYAEEVNLKYVFDIGSLVNELLGREAINKEVIDRIKLGNKIICPNCNYAFYDSGVGHWGTSQYGPGISWQVTCPKCRYNCDTGEFWDE